MSLKIFNQGLGLILLVLVSTCSAAFPDDPKPCDFADSKCISERLLYYLKTKNSGDPSINLASVDPLVVKKLHLKQGAESPVSIDLTFTDSKIYGLSSVKLAKVKGFGKDPNTIHELQLRVGNTHLVGNYKIGGKVLILPISGNGASNITEINSKLTLTFKGESYEKDGKVYMKVTDTNIKIEPKKVIYEFKNLFNGDKALTENMNAFLNSNDMDIYREIQVPFEKSLSGTIEQVLNDVFSKMPYEEFFNH